MKREFNRGDVLFAAMAGRLGLVGPAQLYRAVQAGAGAGTLAERLEAVGALGARDRRRIEAELARVSSDPTPERAASPGRRAPPDAETIELATPSPSPPTTAREQGPPAEPGACLPLFEADRYEVLGVQGTGGQGRVLVALDRSLGRKVAIKEFVDQPGPEPLTPQSVEAMERFLCEAQVTGQLEHPNIVPVYEVGRRADGTCYYSMRLVHGQTLSDRLAACDGLADRLKLLGAFSDLANAIAFAHARGVVHRDIKPANVMVDELGQTVVLDWGVAKVRGRSDRTGRAGASAPCGPDGNALTSDGSLIGTPGYMSPEQAAGAVERIDERSDVWALGAVLYEILSGRRAFRGATPEQTLELVKAGRPGPIRQIVRAAPPELCAIATKALQLDPDLRYQSAREVAEEIEAFLTGGRVSAHRYTSLALLRRAAAQNKVAFGAAGLTLAAILASLVVVALAWRDEAAALAREQAERRVAHYHLAQAYAEKAERLAERSDLPSARVYAAAALLHNPANPLGPHSYAGFGEQQPSSHELWIRASARYEGYARLQPVELERALELAGLPMFLALSPDGERLVVATHQATLEVWEPAVDATRPIRVLPGHEADVSWAGFSPDGRLLVSSGYDRRVILRDGASFEPLATLPEPPARYFTGAFSPDGRLLALGAQGGQVDLVDVARRRPVERLSGLVGEVFGLSFTPDGGRLAATGEDGRVLIFDPGSGRLLESLPQTGTQLMSLAFSPDGRWLAAGGLDGRLRVWRQGERVARVVAAHANVIHSVAFSPDGERLATSSADGTFALWDLASLACLAKVRGHADAVVAVAYSPDGRRLVTVGRDRRMRIWRLREPRTLPSLVGHTERIYALSPSPDGRLLATGAWDRKALLWRLPAGSAEGPLAVLGEHGDMVYGLAFSPDGALLATACLDAVIRLFDSTTGRLVRELRGHTEGVNGVAFSPDGTLLASAGWDQTIRLWRPADGAALGVLTGHRGRVARVVFSPDGALLASAGFDGTVRLWSARTGAPIRVLAGHAARVSGLAFSPDGRVLASSGEDAQIILWDPLQGRELRRLLGHARWVNSVEFSGDGRLLASASDDATVRIWGLDSDRLVQIIFTRTEAVGIAFLDGGRTLAVGDHDRVVMHRLFSPETLGAPDRLLDEAERLAGRRLRGFDLGFE